MSSINTGNDRSSEHASGKTKGKQTLKASKQNSRKIASILSTGPHTSDHIYRGSLLSYDDDMLLLFGRVADKRKGAVMKGDDEIRIESSSTYEIEKGLEEDAKSGYLGDVHHIKSSPITVLGLFLEGAIKPESIKNAIATDSTVILHDVEFSIFGEKKPFTIMCREDFPFRCATIDSKGQTIN